MNELSSLEQVIAFLALKAQQDLTITQVMKLVYLADVEHVREYGVQLCETSWTWYHYGPFSLAVYGAVEVLDQQGWIQDSRLENGARSVRPTPSTPDRLISELSPKMLRTLTRVVQQFGHMTLRQLKNAAYQSEPMLHATEGESLDLSHVPRSDLAGAVPELSLFIQLAPKPDTRSWGDPAASAEEDDAIMRTFSGLRRQSNTELE